MKIGHNQLQVLFSIWIFAFPIFVFAIMKYLFDFSLYRFPITQLIGDLHVNDTASQQQIVSEYSLLTTLFVLSLLIYFFAGIFGFAYAIYSILATETFTRSFIWIIAGLIYGSIFVFLAADRNDLGVFIVNDHVMNSKLLDPIIKAQFTAVDQLMLWKDRLVLPCAGVMLACLAKLSARSVYDKENHVFLLRASRNRINVLIYIAGILFVANVTCLLLLTRWSSSLVAIYSAQSVSMLRAAVTIYWGAIMGFCFAAAFLPALLAMLVARRRAFITFAPSGIAEANWYKENDLQLSGNDLSSRVFAFLAPILVGPVLEFIVLRF